MLPKSYKLNNGMEIPSVGLGTCDSTRDAMDAGDVMHAVMMAIDAGYRHFDCAWVNGTEYEVGAAIHVKIDEGVVKREDLFITTKLWNSFHAKDWVVPMLNQSLESLNLEYVDLYLIQFPFGFKEQTEHWPIDATVSDCSDVDYLETWEGMEECVKLGLTKSIGISNFNSEQTDRLLKNCNIKPVVNQVEFNPNLNQMSLLKFSQQRDIILVGYCTLGRSNDYPGLPEYYPEPTIFDPKVIEMAIINYNKTAAQVVLNYLVSLGIVVIPKSVTESRIIENIDIFDFKLEQEDVAYLDSCNKNMRIASLSEFKHHKYYPFNTEY